MRSYLFLSLALFSSLAMSAATQPQMDAALAEVKAEDMVFDAQWSEDDVLVMRLRVFDNGEQRNAYAGYICMLLAEHGITDVKTSVVDVVSKSFRELGSADCSQLSR
jgi:hypothetical protein